MHGNEEIDLGVLADPPPGLLGALERWSRRLDELRSRPEVVSFVVVLVCGLFALSYFVSRRSPQVDVAELIPEIRLETTVPNTITQPDILIHVTGAVHKPGVYALGVDARVLDAIAAAGGATTDGLLHELNLAAPLADGMQVRVPVEGEVVVGLVSPLTGVGGPVNVNSASASDLESLNGIGPSLAGAIVNYRDEHGQFIVAEDLLSVPGIGPAKLELLRDQISLG